MGLSQKALGKGLKGSNTSEKGEGKERHRFPVRPAYSEVYMLSAGP